MATRETKKAMRAAGINVTSLRKHWAGGGWLLAKVYDEALHIPLATAMDRGLACKIGEAWAAEALGLRVQIELSRR